jgi:hypothetical protein
MRSLAIRSLALGHGVRASAVLAALSGLVVTGCAKDDRDSEAGLEGIGDGIDDGIDDDDDDDDEEEDDDDGSDSPLLDQGGGSEEGEVPCGEGQLCEGECDIPEHIPCDAAANTPLIQTMGLNCGNELQVQVTTNGNPGAMGRRNAFGGAGAFPPREGSGYVVIGSGLVSELDSPGYPGNFNGCSDDMGGFDPLDLPPPVIGTNVGAQTCTDDPALIGTGDCSNTIQGELTNGVFDYTEIAFSVTVPTTVNSFSYDLAFFSIEYPEYFGSDFNDMYIGWLESEAWTGNISFDAQGKPISLNAGFLDYKDACAALDPMCGSGVAPELHGTCMQGHAGTSWLTSSASVVPGEQITVIFAIFDQGDGILDSYAFLDNFQWGCNGELPPQTVPIG